MGYIGSDPKTNESVSTAQLVDDSVTNAKIVDNVLFTSVTSSVVSASSTITADTFTGTFSGALSSSAQIATSISGSSTSLSSSLSTRATTLESASGSFASDLVTLKGSGTTQGVGQSNSPTFTAITVNTATVTGTLTAQEVHTEFESASVIFTSGSTIFGNSIDDVHNMTGSLNVSGSLDVNDGNLSITDKMVVGSGSSFNFSNTNHPFTVRSSGNNAGFSVLGSQGTELLRFIQESNDSGKLDMYDGGSLKLRLSAHASENNYINNGGNLGIGTSSPSAPLHISKDVTQVSSSAESKTQAGFYLNSNPTYGSNSLTMFEMSSSVATAGTYGIQVANSAGTATYPLGLQPYGGRVGIGTGSPDSLLHVKTTANVSETIRIQNDDSLTTVGVSSDGYSFHTYQHSLYLASWDGSTWSTKARWDSNGNLGIGHLSPQFGLTLAQGDTDAQAIGWEDAGSTKRASIYCGTSDDSLRLYVNGGDRVKIATNGNVGIGVGSSSPVGKLDISQGGYTAGTQAIHFGADSGNNTSRSNNTTKYGVITGEHYSTSEEKIELITYYSNSSANSISIGGSGNSAYNAPTEIGLRIASGYTVTSNNAITILTINGAGATIKEGYPLYAGRAATSGGRILAGHYNQTNGDYLAVLSTHYSSGGFIVGYGVEGKENSSGYVSTQDAFNGVRTAMTQDTDGIHFLTSAATQASPGSDVTMNERARITAAGYLKAGNLLADDYSNYDASDVIGDTDHALVNRENSSYVLRCWQTHASNPYGIIVKYVNADISNTSNHFFVGAEDNQDRFQLRSNGGLANVQSNNADLSDERTKKDITDTSSQYDFIKSLRVRNFKYKVDTDDDRVKTGVIAQEVESIDSSLIDNTGEFSTQYIDEDEEPAKMVYDKDIYFRAIKALQEAMEKIEILEAQMAQVSGSS